MSAFLLLTTVRVQTTVSGFVRGLAERLADDERGQDMIEYLGVLAIVAALIGVVVTLTSSLGAPIKSGASKVISEVFNH
jgi:Flp pilus assembly pilin Flp